jgi:hypothetical protein
LTSIEIKIFRRTAGTPCLTTKGMKKFWKSWECRTIWRDTKKIQIKLAATCNQI